MISSSAAVWLAMICSNCDVLVGPCMWLCMFVFVLHVVLHLGSGFVVLLHAERDAWPNQIVTLRANPGQSDRSTNGKTIELLSTQMKDTYHATRLPGCISWKYYIRVTLKIDIYLPCQKNKFMSANCSDYCFSAQK